MSTLASASISASTSALMLLLIIPLAYALPSDSAICDSMTDCVIQGVCYSTGTMGPDVDLDGDNDYCLNNIWVDCGSGCSDCCEDREKCIEHDCETNICPDLADSNEGECQTQTGRTDAWGLLRGDSITNCFIDMCCGDDDYEYIYHCEIGYGITYSSPKCSSEDVCCSYDTECVYDGHCYSTEEGHLLDNTKSMNDYYSYCTSKEWVDSDTSALRCSCNDCGWAVAEEIIGEYTDTTTEECCGDDPNEYYSEPCTTGNSKCCPQENMCVDASGACVEIIDSDCGDTTCDDEGTPGAVYCTACSENYCDLAGVSEGCYWDGSRCLKDGTYWDMSDPLFPEGKCLPTASCNDPCTNPFSLSCYGANTDRCTDGEFCCEYWPGEEDTQCFSQGMSYLWSDGSRKQAYRCY